MTKDPPIQETLAFLREAGFDDYPCPWSHEAAKLVAEHGPYADYSGWERWMDGQMDRPCYSQPANTDGCRCSACEMAVWWDAIEGFQKTYLYGVMCTACRFTATEGSE